jgi:hypothetical protein
MGYLSMNAGDAPDENFWKRYFWCCSFTANETNDANFANKNWFHLNIIRSIRPIREIRSKRTARKGDRWIRNNQADL